MNLIPIPVTIKNNTARTYGEKNKLVRTALKTKYSSDILPCQDYQ